MRAGALFAFVVALSVPVAFGTGSTLGQGAGVRVPEPQLLPGQKTFNLTTDETRQYARSKNFEVVGHSYFKGDWSSRRPARVL